MRPFPRLIAVVLMLLPGAMTAAQEVAPAPEASAVPSAGEAASVAVPLMVPDSCLGYYVDDPRWFDRAQGFFSQRACTPAVWFDRFFGDERDEDVASALVRVVPSLQYSDRDFTDSGIRLKARVNLPNLRDRFSLVVNGDAEESAGLLPGEVERPEQANAADRDTSAALRYLARRAADSGVDFDIGLRSQLKFFARARYYRSWQLAGQLRTRYTQSFWFRDGSGFGETSLFEVERMLAEDMLLRWSTQAILSEEANGLDLRDGLQLLRQIDRDRAISWNLAMTVKSDPAWQAQAYVTSVRYRQRAFRPWFFFEVEPFIDAIRDDRFNTNPGIAFRVEIWLGDSRDGGAPATPPASANAAPPVTSPTSDVPSAGP